MSHVKSWAFSGEEVGISCAAKKLGAPGKNGTGFVKFDRFSSIKTASITLRGRDAHYGLVHWARS